ncbi:MAG TPA: hypothetical protein VGO93_01885, partial [Candidatus Xenobia bacterium]
MDALNAGSIIGMVVATVVLAAIAIWAQTFHRQPRNIIGNRNLFLAGSGVLILVCLIAMVFRHVTTGWNFGMDFTGGTVIEVGFYENTDSLTTDKVADAVVKADPELRRPEVQLEEQVTRAAEPQQTTESASPSGSPAES